MWNTFCRFVQITTHINWVSRQKQYSVLFSYDTTLLHWASEPCCIQETCTGAVWPRSERTRARSTPPYYHTGRTRAKSSEDLRTVSGWSRECSESLDRWTMLRRYIGTLHQVPTATVSDLCHTDLVDQVILWGAHLINVRYIALIDNGRLRDQFVVERRLSEHADIHDRRSTRFWAIGESLGESFECTILKVGKAFLASSFQKWSISLCCSHIRPRKQTHRMTSRFHVRYY